MNTNSAIKEMVREKYTAIANQSKEQNETSCCGATGCGETDVYNIMSEDYTKLEGYNADADLGLGCGLPTEFAKNISAQLIKSSLKVLLLFLLSDPGLF